MNKVYIVKSYENIWGVYTTKEIAEKGRKKAQRNAEMGGSHAIYRIEEYEVKNNA